MDVLITNQLYVQQKINIKCIICFISISTWRMHSMANTTRSVKKTENVCKQLHGPNYI